MLRFVFRPVNNARRASDRGPIKASEPSKADRDMMRRSWIKHAPEAARKLYRKAK